MKTCKDKREQEVAVRCNANGSEWASADKAWLKGFMTNDNNNNKPKNTDDEPQKPKESGETVTEYKPKGRGLADIAGMESLKQKVREDFINVLQNAKFAKAYGIRPPSMLFYGPPGCGKTFFAEKMAEEMGINFMKVVPDDIASQMVHGTQQKIGEVFRKAERKAPTLLFFDEFEAMVPRRKGDETNQHYDSEVNEFLCMLNNATARGIYVVAASNHPELIDKAVLRTGRIDELIYIDMPDTEARKSLFWLRLAELPVEDGIDMERLAKLTEGFNCSDIAYIVESAARKKFNETIAKKDGKLQAITQELLEEIISTKRPSVTKTDLRNYEQIRHEFSPKDEGCKHVGIGFR